MWLSKFTFKTVHPSSGYCQQEEKMGFYKGWTAVFDRLVNLLPPQS